MKRQIRRGTFETNSSSTHSLTFMMGDDFARWRREHLYLCVDAFGYDIIRPEVDKLYTKEEVKNFVRHNKYYDGEFDFDDDSILYEKYGFRSFGYENDELESYCKEYVTPLGEKIIAFGEYGYC